ncbi:hypothetical protein Ciccas_003001 [Cichlidogyrus casuarinus]|uniref:Glycogen debranching enzyme n=1 Tax=Cichlidogyrus casuarinus TaxID=1844966 RepID=A0ABD2QFM3_9PLAT
MAKPIANYVISQDKYVDDKIYRVRKEWVLRFVLDKTLEGKPVRFFTNYVLQLDGKFERFHFSELHLSRSKQGHHFELENLHVSGAFQFFFTIDGSDSSAFETQSVSGGGYFIVDPRFNDANRKQISNRQYWSLDGIVLQTYLAKNLGHFEEWSSRLEAALALNYNMIHFTPLQELGYSRSAYSLRDHLRVNPEFSSSTQNPIDWNAIKKFVESLEHDHGVLSMTDLVFNHASNDAPWLHEHPECGYNVVNSPHLAGAYVLDRIVRMMSIKAAKNQLECHGIHAEFRHSSMDPIRDYLFRELDRARIYEFYISNVDSVVKQFGDWLKAGRPDLQQFTCGNCLPDKYCNDHDIGDVIPHHLWLRCNSPKRFSGTVDFKLATLHCLRQTDPSSYDSALSSLKSILLRLNHEKAFEVQQHIQAAVNNKLYQVDLKQLQNQLLSCARCKDRFERDGKVPLLLSCGCDRWFCDNCLISDNGVSGAFNL